MYGRLLTCPYRQASAVVADKFTAKNVVSDDTSGETGSRNMAETTYLDFPWLLSYSA
jgi:hypothetical protein